MKRVLTLKEYWRKKYGFTLRRLAADPGFPCPHRDPSGQGGCIFCSSAGGRARHLTGDMSPEMQIERGVRYLRTRYHAEPPYALYFQAFTPTNAPLPELKKVYGRFLAASPEIAAVIVAARPDCLPDEVLDYFCELQEKYEVWVELGVQTACDRTLQRINRGHDFQCVREAVLRLASRKIPCAAHVILGLPGETQKDFDATADALAALPFSGVKIHHLLVLKDTPLEMLWRAGQVHTMDEAEYASVLCRFLERLPDGWIVMRLSADEGEGRVLAPRWFLDKAAFDRMFLRMYASSGEKRSLFPPVATGDGSITFLHPGCREYFHPLSGAERSVRQRFLEPSDLPELFRKETTVRILDTGAGPGYALRAAVRWAEEQKKGRLEITALEKELFGFRMVPGLPSALAETGRQESKYASVTLIPGDARQTAQHLPEHFFHRIFLDGFSPRSNPELWTADFLAKLRSLLTAEGRILLSSDDYAVRSALLELGFHLYGTEGGTIASIIPLSGCASLPERERKIILCSTSGTPFRDPGLSGTRQEILDRRKEELLIRRKAGVPKRCRE